MIDAHTPFVTRAYELALKSYTEGGCPIGSVIVRDGAIIGEGHNQRIQQGDPIAHGEMDALRNAGRQTHYRDTTLYTSLSPCMMCAGTIVQFGIPRVVVGDVANAASDETIRFMRAKGVEVVVLDPQTSAAARACVELVATFRREKPEQWLEDWGGGLNPALTAR